MFPSRQNLTGYLYFPSNNKFVSNTYETELADDRIRVQEFQPNAISKELDIPLTDYTFYWNHQTPGLAT